MNTMESSLRNSVYLRFKFKCYGPYGCDKLGSNLYHSKTTMSYMLPWPMTVWSSLSVRELIATHFQGKED